MKKLESILHPIGRVHGGTTLPHLKGTADCETVIMPPPEIVRIPLSQHIGAPATPIVKKDDKVYVGTLIGKANGFVSAPVHSSISGTVEDVKYIEINGKNVKAVIIKSDGLMTKDPSLKPYPVILKEDISKAADSCGLVGLGGAGFPTKVKLLLKDEVPIDTLIINGAECEPYITSDYRECIENYDNVIEGVYFLKEKLNIQKVIICIESNKEKAIKKLYVIASDKRDMDDSVKLMELPTSYPQGAEKMIIYSATGRKLPLGKLPSDVGCIVMNITSIATLYNFIKTGMPLVSKRVTVEGTAVNEPKNVIAPIGTSVKDLLEFAGGVSQKASEIIMGGPMMGTDLCDDSAVIEKRTNAITVMSYSNDLFKTTACIKCGRCSRACPMNLYPAAVDSVINFGDKSSLQKMNVNYCIECGSCSFVCPAKRPLTQLMRLAKAELRREKSK